MLRKVSMLFIAAALAQPASADVMFSWRLTQASPSMPPGLNLELVFSDAAVAAGSLVLDIDNDCEFGPPCVPDPQTSLLSLNYWFDGGGSQQWNHIQYERTTLPVYRHDRISLNLTFLPHGYLAGSIWANDGFSDFHMQSVGPEFTMVAAHSDEPWACGTAYPDCHGARGVIRDVNAQDLPEPPVLALGLLGAAGAWLARRRRR